MYDPRIVAEPTIFIQGWLWVPLVIAIVAGFVLGRRRPDYALAGVIAAAPLYQLRGNLGVPTTLLELLLGAVLFGIATRWREYRPLKIPYAPWLALWVGGGLLAALVGPDLREGLGLWRAFFAEPALLLVALATVFRKRDPRALVWGAAGAITIVALWAGYLLADGRALTYDDRLQGPFQSANYLALLLVPLTLLLAYWPRRELLFVRVAGVTAGIGMLVASNSRGGQLALLAGVLVGAGLLRGRTRLLMGGLVAATLVVGSLAAGPNLFRHAEDQVVSARPVLWREAAGIIKGNPLFGSGPGQFQEVFTERVRGNPDHLLYVVPQALNPHNVFLVTWTEWGLLTLLGFLGLLAVFARTIWTKAGPWRILALSIMTAIVIHGLVDTSVLKNDLAVVFALALALPLLPAKAGKP